MKHSAAKRRALFYGSLLLPLVGCVVYATAMPGDARAGAQAYASPAVHSLANELKSHVVTLAEIIGERRIGQGDSLARARDYVASELRKAGPAAHVKLEDLGSAGSEAQNVILELPGSSQELVIVGAHYDSAPGTPGANDNASGVAAALCLAKRLSEQRFSKTIRFALFANEEQPYFQSPGMGSLVHASGCEKRGERIVAMLALESLGYYSDAAGSQRYPWPVGLFYPDRADFVGFVGNLGSRSLVRQATGAFREAATFPSEGASLPARIPGVGWSDHWAFWQFDYPAIMVTDTAVFRDPNYHQQSDVAPNVNYQNLARVTLGLQAVIQRLAGRE